MRTVIEVAAVAARATDRGLPIAAAVTEALRTAGIVLPGAAVIELIAIAGRRVLASGQPMAW